jgi:glycosyltransferase involved in cell wall biosynthesis
LNKPSKILGVDVQNNTVDASTSIIVAAYNGEKYLEEALKSALSQTRPAVEVIVVDDGSLDRSADIARACGATVISQANAGRSAARNVGFAASRGDYVVFLDQDDLLLPNNIEVNAAYLDADPSLGFIGGATETIRADGTQTGNTIGADGGPCSYKTLLEGEAFVPPSSVMFRRTAFEDIGAFDPEFRLGNEDLDVYLKVARAWPVQRHGEIVVKYRRHDDNGSINAQAILASVRVLLEAQRPHCTGEPALIAAIEQGKRHWVDIYGPGLVGKAVGDLRRGRIKNALHGFGLALRFYPKGFPQYVASKF